MSKLWSLLREVKISTPI